MNLLVDTHILIWSLQDSERLTASIRNALQTPRNQVFVSSISIFEILIKAQRGKLRIPVEFQAAILRQDMKPLPFNWQHAEQTRSLSPWHSDPFDRALLGQAKAEGLTLVSADELVLRYSDEVRVLEA